MPRVRSQYIAEMRERFEVVDRVKASAEEKASLTKAIENEQESISSPEASPSKENTLRKDEAVKLKFEDDNLGKDEDEIQEEKIPEDEEEEDVESGKIKVTTLKKLLAFLFGKEMTP